MTTEEAERINQAITDILWPLQWDARFCHPYCSDKNCVGVAVKRLSHNQWDAYLTNLEEICVPVHVCQTTHQMAMVEASAEQRAKALLKTLQETKP